MMKHSKPNEHPPKHKPKNTDAEHAEPEVAGQPGAPVPPAAAPPANDPPSQPSDVEQLKDRLLRLQADFDNFRKRTTRDRGDMILRANSDLLLELLPVVDNLERALEQARTMNITDPFVTGVQLVLDQLHSALRKYNVTAFDAIGQQFDVTRHEAISHTPSTDHPENTVIAQTRRGYLLGETLLRPAQVIVAAHQPEPAVPAGESASKDKSP
jgi:molecular chaperone GrpE